MSAAEMREALKPCPFCGGADIRRDDHGFPVSFACEDCGARGGASEESLSEAADFWNRRTPLPDEEGMVERVARALAAYQFSREDYWEDQVDMALFVIRAINGGKP